MPAAEFLWQQLEGEKEAWKADHDEAMACYDVEDLIRRGIGLFGMIRLADESWSRQVQSGAKRFDSDKVRLIRKQYEWWLAPCARVLASLAEAEKSFRQVENAAYFRQCVSLARRLIFVDIEGLIESGAQVARGEIEPYEPEVTGGAKSIGRKGQRKAFAPCQVQK